MRGLFVTGTDTDCGKTLVSVALIKLLVARGHGVAGFKPVAAGAKLLDGELKNTDAITLAAAATVDMPYQTVNPYCFSAPIAPHIAAAQCGVRIESDVLLAAATELAGQADRLIVEGAGGWRVPLHGEFDIQALSRMLHLPVLLVVGLKLGCLNHALLTAQAIVDSGQELFGWVATQPQPGMACLDENIATLKASIKAPCLGVIPYAQAVDVDAVVARLAGERLALL